MKTLLAFLGMMLVTAGLWAGEVTVNSGTQATVSFTSGTGGVVTDADGALSVSNSIELLAGCIFYWDGATVSGGFLGDPGGTGVLTIGKNGGALTNLNGGNISSGTVPVARLPVDGPTITNNGTTLTATLLSAVGNKGRCYTIKEIANSSGTVATTSSQNIDASTTYSLAAQYNAVTVQSDGTQWWVIAVK